MEFLPFVVATFSLLAVPGPTNALLATSGASTGISRSIHLLAAALAGYLTSVAALRLGLGPLMMSVPLAAWILRAAVIIYLVHIASLLWRYRSSSESRDPAPVSFKSVLVTTLLNPKGLVLALVLLPQHPNGSFELLPWIATMAVLIVAIGLAWIAMGATLERALREAGRPDLMYRLSAAVLVVMATAMGAQTLV